MIHFTTVAIIFTFVGLFIAPRLTVSIILLAIGQIALGILGIVWVVLRAIATSK